MTAKSIRPAFSASICGGPDVNVEKTTRYRTPSSALAACNKAWVPPFWSPTYRVTPDSFPTTAPWPARRSLPGVPSTETHTRRTPALQLGRRER